MNLRLKDLLPVTLLVMTVVVVSTADARGQAVLTVTVKGIKGNGGSIRIGLFSNEKDFLHKATEAKDVPVSGGEVTITFDNLPPGSYAISAIHDANNNNELDKNFLGIPREGFCFGNNAMGSFGPPSFEKAKVIMKSERLVQELVMKYL